MNLALVSLLLASVPLDVPFVRQEKFGCGSAAIAMVIQYWARQFPSLAHAAVQSERINDMLPPDPARGIRGDALRRYLQDVGFSAFVISAAMSDLEHHVSKGRPVVVCIAPAGPGKPLHYAVVVNIDRHSVWLNDPARGRLLREDARTFDKQWSATGNWALLAVPRAAQHQ